MIRALARAALGSASVVAAWTGTGLLLASALLVGAAEAVEKCGRRE